MEINMNFSGGLDIKIFKYLSDKKMMKFFH